MKFIDVHAHVLPGVDDGPDTAQETLRMLAVAYRHGTRAIVATPHAYISPYEGNTPEVIRNAYRNLVTTLAAWAKEPAGAFLGDMRLYLGAEHHLSSDFLEALAARQVVPLNDSAYLLVEPSPYLSFELLDAGVGRILEAGFFPVLAHVERYEIFRERPRRLAALVARGCVTQVNAVSVLKEGRRHRAARDLLRRGLVHVVASDGHGSIHRPPNLRPAAEELRRLFSRDQVKAWMFDNPGRLLNNRPPVAVD